MSFILRSLRLLAIVVWVGGLIFFAAIEAPTAVHVLGTTRPFALLIGNSLRELNEIGHICGFLFLLATIAFWFRTDARSRRLLMIQSLLVILMIVATMAVQSRIIPAMERDRAAAGGDIASVPADNSARADFDRLHALSEKVEGAALFLGLGVVLLLAAEPARLRQVES